MKNQVLLILAMIAVGTAIFAYGKHEPRVLLPATPPKDFSLIFSYDVGRGSTLDTVRGTLKVGCVTPNPVPFKLTPSELKAIYAQIVKSDLMNYPQGYTPRIVGRRSRIVDPHSSYSIHVRCQGQVKTISWEDHSEGFGPFDARAQPLYELIRFIKKTIQAKPAYKKLPPSYCGYA